MKFVIYGKKGCSFCARAVSLALLDGLDYEYLSLGEDYDKDELVSRSGINSDKITYPQVFIEKHGDMTLIGGFTDFEQYVAG